MFLFALTKEMYSFFNTVVLIWKNKQTLINCSDTTMGSDTKLNFFIKLKAYVLFDFMSQPRIVK